jgi:hypothetical protein
MYYGLEYTGVESFAGDSMWYRKQGVKLLDRAGGWPYWSDSIAKHRLPVETLYPHLSTKCIVCLLSFYWKLPPPIDVVRKDFLLAIGIESISEAFVIGDLQDINGNLIEEWKFLHPRKSALVHGSEKTELSGKTNRIYTSPSFTLILHKDVYDRVKDWKGRYARWKDLTK